MLKELMVRQFNGHDVKTVMIDGQPHWVAKDIGRFLEIQNMKDAVSNFKIGTQRIVIEGKDNLVGITDQPNTYRLTLLTEAGLYKLVFKSRKPEAEKFTDWLAEEVLPQVRQTGTYSMAIPAPQQQLLLPPPSAPKDEKTLTKILDQARFIEKLMKYAGKGPKKRYEAVKAMYLEAGINLEGSVK